MRFPADESQAAPLEGAPGTEVIALCIKHAGPITNEEMKRLWQMDEPWRPLPGARTLQIDPQTLKLLQANRGFGAPRTRVDDEELLRRQLIRQAERLTAACDYFEILAIPYTARLI